MIGHNVITNLSNFVVVLLCLFKCFVLKKITTFVGKLHKNVQHK